MDTFDNSILAAFGLVNVHFAKLEMELSLNTAKLIGPHDSRIGNIVTAGLDIKKVLDLFASLVIHRTPLSLGLPGADEIRAGLPNIVSTIDRIRERRNTVVHSYWEPGPTTQDTSTGIRLKEGKSAKRGYETAIETWTVHQLHEFVGEIQRAEQRLKEFVCLADSRLGLFPE